MRGRRQFRPASHSGFTPLKPPRPRDGDQHHPEKSVTWTQREVWGEGVRLGWPHEDSTSPPTAHCQSLPHLHLGSIRAPGLPEDRPSQVQPSAKRSWAQRRLYCRSAV